jgi:hypothetical protein
VTMVAAGQQMSGDPLALQKDLDGSRGQPHLHLVAGKAVGHTVEMTFELDPRLRRALTSRRDGSLLTFRWSEPDSNSRSRCDGQRYRVRSLKRRLAHAVEPHRC